jgi:hypothetical protein
MDQNHLRGNLFFEYLLSIRKYLLNVANTVTPNSVVDAVIRVRKAREKSGLDE